MGDVLRPEPSIGETGHLVQVDDTFDTETRGNTRSASWKKLRRAMRKTEWQMDKSSTRTIRRTAREMTVERFQLEDLIMLPF